MVDYYQWTNIEDLNTNKAPLASPTFTGVPAAPTASKGTNTTQLATTAFVMAATVPWVEVTGTSQQMAVNTAYLANNAAQVSLALPATADVKSIIRVAGSGAGGWKITQNASQQIVFGGVVSTVGTGGYMVSMSRYEYVELICIVANTVFSVIGATGNPDVV